MTLRTLAADSLTRKSLREAFRRLDDLLRENGYFTHHC